MKRERHILFVLAVCTLLPSCNRLDLTPYVLERHNIIFCAEEDSEWIETKAEKTTSLSSFNVSATTGWSTETLEWNNKPFVQQGGVFVNAEALWSVTNIGYHFFASNKTLLDIPSGISVSATNDRDVVVAYMPSPEFQGVNTLVFKHVFSAIKQARVVAGDGSTISDASVLITPKTGGTFNIKAGYGQDAAGWSDTVEGKRMNIVNATPGSWKSINYLLVPGTYTLRCSWFAEKGGNRRFNADVEKEIFLSAGQEYSLTITMTWESIILTFSCKPIPYYDPIYSVVEES